MAAGRLRILISLVLVAAVGAIGAIGYRTFAPMQAPAVAFTMVAGNRLVLRELRGAPVLVTFWASDCRTCLQEMPALEELYRRHAGRGLKMIGVAMSYDMPSRVMELIRSGQISYPVAFDLGAKLAKAFGDVALVPNSFLIAPDGRVVLHQLGLLDMSALNAQIEQLLQED